MWYHPKRESSKQSTMETKAIILDKDGTLFPYTLWTVPVRAFLTSALPLSCLEKERREKCISRFSEILGLSEKGDVKMDGLFFRRNYLYSFPRLFFASLSFGLSPLKVANGLLKIEKRWEYGMTETLEAYDFSSTRRLLDKAKKSNVKLALFTNDSPSSTEAFLKTFGEDYFSFLVDSSSPHHKPSVKTIEDFSLFSRVKPSEMALISDSSRDLRMGRKGGVGKLIGILGTEKKERLERYTSFVFPDIESALKSLI